MSALRSRTGEEAMHEGSKPMFGLRSLGYKLTPHPIINRPVQHKTWRVSNQAGRWSNVVGVEAS
jgi:hypothetical protein